MLPRILRVARAKNAKNAKNTKSTKSATRDEGPSFQDAESVRRRPKVPLQEQSLTGRAHKLLGRAGAAKLRAPRGQQRLPSRSRNGVVRSSGSISPKGETQRINGRKPNRPSNRSKEFRIRGRKKA